MNSVQFHDTLLDWSTAKSLDTLANKILEIPITTPLKYREVNELVNTRIKKFICENKERFFAIDIPTLKKIQRLLPPQTYVRPEQKNHIMELREILNQMEELSTAKSDLSVLPPELTSLCLSFASMNDKLKLPIGELVSPSPILSKSFANISCTEIPAFVQELRQRYLSHPHIFRKMVSTFFEHASQNSQVIFFQCLVPKDSKFLSDIISALPTRLLHLKLDNCKCLQDVHVIKILDHLVNLTTLIVIKSGYSLTDVRTGIYLPTSCLTSQSFENLTKVSKLQYLTINNIPLNDKTLESISRLSELRSLDLYWSSLSNPNLSISLMSKLNFLDLSYNGEFHDLTVNGLNIDFTKQITSSQSVKHLNVRNCGLTVDTFVEILNMPSLKTLDFRSNQCLRDDIFPEIINKIKKSNVKILDVRDCQHLTDHSVLALVKNLKSLTTIKFDWRDPIIQTEAENIFKERLSKLPNHSTTKKRKLICNDALPN